MKLDNLRGSGITKLFPARSIDYLPRRFAPLEIISIEREIILLCPPPSVSNVTFNIVRAKRATITKDPINKKGELVILIM